MGEATATLLTDKGDPTLDVPNPTSPVMISGNIYVGLCGRVSNLSTKGKEDV